MMVIPLFVAVIVNTSTPFPNNKEQETPIYDASVETIVDNEREGESSIDRSLETTDDDKKERYSPKKITSSSDCSLLQHSTPVFRSTTPLLQSAPPTKHPIERKTIKAISGYALGFTALYCGIHAGVSLGDCLGLSFLPSAGLSLTIGIIAGALTIHYTWQFINYWFSE
ncbi:MAG: hypothetical protein K2W97_06965 [Chthoniobacterales bacterium]|nr:hypothetical protein [Chthoniobacterales bacterium]